METNADKKKEQLFFRLLIMELYILGVGKLMTPILSHRFTYLFLTIGNRMLKQAGFQVSKSTDEIPLYMCHEYTHKKNCLR